MDRPETDNLIERIATLRKIELRKAAAREKLQLVHAEILDYMAFCNRYSNTTLAVSDYLGQTKGTVSQSLQLLEKKGLLARETDKHDRRVARLSLTQAGKQAVARLHRKLPVAMDRDAELTISLRHLLTQWQQGRAHASFGLCRTCKHNIDLGDDQFKCGLTGESLKKAETEKICREHEYPS